MLHLSVSLLNNLLSRVNAIFNAGIICAGCSSSGGAVKGILVLGVGVLQEWILVGSC